MQILTDTYYLFTRTLHRITRFYLLTLVCVVLVKGADFAHAQVHKNGEIHTSNEAHERRGSDQDIFEQLTQRMETLNAQHNQAEASRRSEILQELEAIAKKRQQYLMKLLKDDLETVINTAISEDVYNHLPLSIRELVESNVEQEGTLEAWCVNPDAPIQYFLNNRTERIALHFNRNPLNLMTDNRVRVKGLLLPKKDRRMAGPTDAEMVIELNEENVILMADGGESTTNAPSSSTLTSGETYVLPDTFGVQKTAVLLVRYKDDPIEPPLTVEEARNLVFGEVHEFFLENSFSQTWLEGDVFGWFKVPISSSEQCVENDAARAADEMAINAGVNLDAYRRIIYIYSSNTCSSPGFGTVGGNPSRAYIMSHNSRVIAHELGHNFGLRHSHSLDCGDVTLASDCAVKNYGDSMCTMGGTSDAFHYNALQKERLGWLDPNDSTILMADGDGVYTIHAYETQDMAPKALKIFKGIDSSTGAPLWYYVEYRQPIGFDAPLADRSYIAYRDDVTHGVEIHMGNVANTDSTYLLHMNPDSLFREKFGILDWEDPALPVGNSYSDGEAGVTIEALSADGDQAAVRVSFQGPICSQADPGVMLTPSSTNTGGPGSTVVYTVSVTNLDNGACEPSDFSISASVPDGWNAMVVDPSISLAPGDTMTTTLEVTSPLATIEGTYPISATAENTADPNYWGIASESCVIMEEVQQNSPPTANNDTVNTSPNSAVTIDVLANDFDPDNDALVIKSITQAAKGQVTVNADSTVTYSPGSNAKRSDSFTYTITDGQHEVSAMVTVKFQKSSGDGSGGGKGNGKKR